MRRVARRHWESVNWHLSWNVYDSPAASAIDALDQRGLFDRARVGIHGMSRTGYFVWAERDPTFHLDRVHAPLRIETYESGPTWWDTYAILRRHGRPVEYWSFPEGARALAKPRERLTSQEGAVDWYDFWLNGHEDQQYARWRKPRAQQGIGYNFAPFQVGHRAPTVANLR